MNPDRRQLPMSGGLVLGHAYTGERRKSQGGGGAGMGVLQKCLK